MQDNAPSNASPEQAVLARRLSEMLRGYQRTQLLYAAAKLGLADLLAPGAKSVDELASATATHKPSLYRLLRALAGEGVFFEREDGSFELTPLASLLQSSVEGSLRTAALTHGEDFYPAWGGLLGSVQTGRSAFENLYGVSNWEYRRRHPEMNERFNAIMAEHARQAAAGLIGCYVFPQQGLVVDIGGGSGTLLAAILGKYPRLSGVLLDQPHVVVEAEAVLKAAGVDGRCEVVAGDFFEAVPADGDVYVLSWILHDWDDDRSAQILARCRGAMKPESRLLLIERVLPPANEPSPSKLGDIHMLVANSGGRERTEAEWRRLLDRGGFELQSIAPALSGLSVLEATAGMKLRA